MAEDNDVELYGSKAPAIIKNPLNDFTKEQIEQLKQNNDWNKEIAIEKCTKVQIVREKVSK